MSAGFHNIDPQWNMKTLSSSRMIKDGTVQKKRPILNRITTILLGLAILGVIALFIYCCVFSGDSDAGALSPIVTCLSI